MKKNAPVVEDVSQLGCCFAAVLRLVVHDQWAVDVLDEFRVEPLHLGVYCDVPSQRLYTELPVSLRIGLVDF